MLRVGTTGGVTRGASTDLRAGCPVDEARDGIRRELSGLAIVREVAAFHGGTVDVVDGDLGGTAFEVRFPRHPD